MKTINGLKYDGAEIVNYPVRGSISVLFQTKTSRDEVHFESTKIEVIRDIYKQCISLKNVLHYELN